MNTHHLLTKINIKKKKYCIYIIKKRIKFFSNFLEKIFISENTMPISLKKKKSPLLSFFLPKALIFEKLKNKVDLFLKLNITSNLNYRIIYVLEEEIEKKKNKCKTCNIDFDYSDKNKILSYSLYKGIITDEQVLSQDQIPKYINNKKQPLILVLEEFKVR
jgi:hypothetical protein